VQVHVYEMCRHVAGTRGKVIFEDVKVKFGSLTLSPGPEAGESKLGEEFDEVVDDLDDNWNS
jgi:hypothetical protein